MRKSNELGWIFLVTAILLFLSYWPITQNFGATPPDRYYYGQEEYPLDMLGDLSYVQQGYQGNLLASFNYGSMIGGHPSIVKTEYIFIGLLGRTLNIPPVVMFFVARFVISLGLLTVIYTIIRQIFIEPWKRIVGYTFVLFGTGITIPETFDAFVKNGMYDTQVFQRLTQAMPHYLLGAGAILLALYFLSRTLERPKNTGMFLWSLIFGIGASLLYAPDNVLFISGFPLYIILDSLSIYLRTKRVRLDMVKAGILFAYSAVTIAPIVYIHYITNYVWSDIRTAWLEQLNPFHLTFVEYVMAMGVLYLLSFISVPSVIRKGKPFMMFLVTWLVMHPVGEYIISPILHINYVRYLLTPYYVALGVFGTSGLIILSQWIQKRMPKMSRWIIVSALVGTVLITSTFTYMAVWQREHLCFCVVQFFDFSYPKKPVIEGVYWLHDNARAGDIVLSSYYAGTLISAFAGNHPYVTWWYRLIDPPTLYNTNENLVQFYKGSMPDTAAQSFLKQGSIAYVFYSEEEQRLSGSNKDNLPYPFLHERYNRGGTIIYQVP